ncbi:MAG TPA: phosphoribosylamine--glycine ligase [Mycobacteriales bacterium]|nr:phosphoribosylamine--glycine ligase [Mycobacteriales bacterium]
MRVLVIGSGGREHALCAALARDPAVSSIVCAPGNAGTVALAEPRALDVSDPDAVAALAADVGADYVVVGPEVPLVAGAADALRARGLEVFGPSAAAARLEGSKAFAKQVMAEAGVPTARSAAFTEVDAALAGLEGFTAPYVVKADGLAAGKGVVVTDDRATAEAHVRACAGDVVLEDYLDGPEASLFCVVDERGGIHPLPLAQDHKRVGDGDTGPNTGGMGAYAPLGWAPPGLSDDVVARVVRPTVAAMAARGTPFSGLLYTGLALTARGPQVVEFNVRFGDPETQAVLALLDSPVTGLLRGTQTPTWRAGAAITVVVAAAGYPDAPRTGDVIEGLDEAARVPGVTVLHAGTKRDGAHVVSAGGRVLSITAVGPDVAAARGSAYEAVGRIRLAGSHHRTDIGLSAISQTSPIS